MSNSSIYKLFREVETKITEKYKDVDLTKETGFRRVRRFIEKEFESFREQIKELDEDIQTNLKKALDEFLNIFKHEE